MPRRFGVPIQEKRQGIQRLILPLPGNDAFAGSLADLSHGEPGCIETRRFPDGESYVRLRGDPAGCPVDLVCTLARPDPQFLSLVYAADAARDSGATEVTLIAPYLAYMRQDKRFHEGESITSLSFARLVSATFDRLLTVDPHLHRYPRLADLYTIPTVILHATASMADWIVGNVEMPLILGPDEESEQWTDAIASRIGAPHRCCARSGTVIAAWISKFLICLHGAIEHPCWWMTSLLPGARWWSRRAGWLVWVCGGPNARWYMPCSRTMLGQN